MDVEHLFLVPDGEPTDPAIAAYTDREYTVLLDLCAGLARAWAPVTDEEKMLDWVEQIAEYVSDHHPDWQG